jgi:hypothetical protein
MKKSESPEPTPATEKTAYVCIPIKDRDVNMNPYLGIDEMNAMHAKGYRWMPPRQSFGCNESYLYFERIDK